MGSGVCERGSQPAMLNAALIVTTGGHVVWSKRFVPRPPTALVDRALHAMLENERVGSARVFEWDGECARWKQSQGLLFFVTYQAQIKMMYGEEVLNGMELEFLKRFGEYDGKDVRWLEPMGRFSDFDAVFTKIVSHAEYASGKMRKEGGMRHTNLGRDGVASSNAASEIDDMSEGVETDSGKILSKEERVQQLRHRGKTSKPEDPGTPKKVRRPRMWEEEKVTEEQLKALDLSGQVEETERVANVDHLVDRSSMGRLNQDGSYTVSEVKPVSEVAQENAVVSFFKTLTGTKALAEADLEPVMAKMKEHLVTKNVAANVAEEICKAVQKGLVGRTLGAFGNVHTEVKKHISEAITKILTPTSSVDILQAIKRTRFGPHAGTRPYTIAFIGVNGVGKSTNLSKVCFWLLQNKFRVLIAACDTFRSGAVEQLRTHVRNLSVLQRDVKEGDQRVELFEKGYGKDSAGIAREAITYAENNGFDVVLIDTAGRMQDNEPLMRALAKLVAVNSPDKIIFVGEALVGNESLAQLTKFNQALKDFSGQRNPRLIDGMILSKFDTVDDKVGAALSMSYVTGKPILFVGTGQTYTDLKAMSIDHVVNTLMKD